MVIAVCGQAVSHTPQATQTSTSLEATWAGVIAKPVLSMLMARAAAALAWAIDSGIVLGPWAVPQRNMPVRCVSTGAQLGVELADEAGRGGLHAGDAGDVLRALGALEAGGEHDEVVLLLALGCRSSCSPCAP